VSAERIAADQTSTFPRFLDFAYPNVERGEGVWLHTTGGEKILDACSGGAMVSSLGNGATEVVEAGARQAERIAYFYMDHFTNEPMEKLADRLIGLAPEMAAAIDRLDAMARRAQDSVSDALGNPIV